MSEYDKNRTDLVSDDLSALRRKAEQGDTKALDTLGSFYLNGVGVPQDQKEAGKWLSLAEDQRNCIKDTLFVRAVSSVWQGRYRIAEFSSSGDVDAVKWYLLVADRGPAWVQCNLGVRYTRGKGVPQDYTEAVKWFRFAADQGHVMARYNLGVCYANGEGVAQDYTEAMKWLCLAAEQGHVTAQYTAGIYCANGTGVLQDYTEAAKWFRFAAEQGHREAQYTLGRYYSYGIGVEQDYTESVKWFSLAAEQGHETAQYKAGVCYASGKGVSQDYAEAVKWFSLAAEQGNVLAENAYRLCARRLAQEKKAAMEAANGLAELRALLAERIARRQAGTNESLSKQPHNNHERNIVHKKYQGEEGGFESSRIYVDGSAWYKNSPLTAMGYHVGASSPLTQSERRTLLEKIYKGSLIFPDDFDAQKKEEWGCSHSRTRLNKIMTHITKQIVLRNNQLSFETAVQEWEDDLDWLEIEFCGQG